MDWKRLREIAQELTQAAAAEAGDATDQTLARYQVEDLADELGRLTAQADR